MKPLPVLVLRLVVSAMCAPLVALSFTTKKGEMEEEHLKTKHDRNLETPTVTRMAQQQHHKVCWNAAVVVDGF